MWMSMFVQYDGELLDPEALRLDLRDQGIEALSITTSCWIRTDPGTLAQSETGGRIDVELPYEVRPKAVASISKLSAVLAASPQVVLS